MSTLDLIILLVALPFLAYCLAYCWQRGKFAAFRKIGKNPTEEPDDGKEEEWP
jgi:hypothetical protein